jgi:hypothetical protein
MPTLGGMAQISRPFQILLVVFALFVAAWFLVLGGHSKSSSSSTPTSSPAVSSSPPAHNLRPLQPAAQGKVYHGSAPGLEGLTRDVARAHGAVAEAQHSGEHELSEAGAGSSAASSSSSAAPSTAAKAAAPQAPAKRTGHLPGSTAAGSTTSAAKPGASHAQTKPGTSVTAPSQSKATATTEAQAGPGRVPARQALVEHALKEGKIAVVLFWNPKGADDVADRSELRLLEAVHHLIPGLARRVPAVRAELERSGLELEKKFAAFEAGAAQVTSFGSITKGVQVYGTPTLLVVNPRGQVITITGLTDAFAIEQAIDEARHG